MQGAPPNVQPLSHESHKKILDSLKEQVAQRQKRRPRTAKPASGSGVPLPEWHRGGEEKKGPERVERIFDGKKEEERKKSKAAKNREAA